jgi:hypothetical protein
MKKMANELDHLQLPAEEASETMTTLLNQHMAIPTSGGLTPNAAIQQRVRATMQPRKKSLGNLRDIFQFRIPMYQAAFGMAMACLIVFASGHILSPNNTATPQASNAGLGLLDSTAVLGALSKDALRTTTSISDSLGAFSPSVVDTL